jgi:hypothetical protein
MQWLSGMGIVIAVIAAHLACHLMRRLAKLPEALCHTGANLRVQEDSRAATPCTQQGGKQRRVEETCRLSGPENGANQQCQTGQPEACASCSPEPLIL